MQYYELNGSKLVQVKFDGFDSTNGVLIDRKLSVTHRNRTYQQAVNQSQGLEQKGTHADGKYPTLDKPGGPASYSVISSSPTSE